MSFASAMQRTMPASTSYQSSANLPAPHIRVTGQYSSSRRACKPSFQCNGYRQQNCGPNSRYGGQPGFGGFGPMMFGDGAMAAAQVGELMQNFARSMNSNEQPTSAGYLAVDIEEQEAKYLLIADIPGLEKADLKISINQTEQTLKIAGERQRAKSSDSTDEQNGKPRFRKQYERGMGKFQRTLFGLPKDADLTAVSAKVDRGVLTISIQKKDLAKDDQEIKINID